jgi:hypothetical protein
MMGVCGEGRLRVRAVQIRLGKPGGRVRNVQPSLRSVTNEAKRCRTYGARDHPPDLSGRPSGPSEPMRSLLQFFHGGTDEDLALPALKRLAGACGTRLAARPLFRLDKPIKIAVNESLIRPATRRGWQDSPMQSAAAEER